MGKTRATYRERLEEFDSDWQMFRRSLVQTYQPYWDEVIRQARQQTMTAGNQNSEHARSRWRMFEQAFGPACDTPATLLAMHRATFRRRSAWMFS
jgi:hypothetical protein